MIKTFICIFIIILSLNLFCSKNNSPLSIVDEYVLDIDYQIYSIVLNKLIDEEDLKIIAVSDTTVYEKIPLNCYVAIKNHLKSLEMETLDNYNFVNKESIKLLNIPDLKIQCDLITFRTYIEQTYPKESSFCRLSKVGYNTEKTQALLYMSDFTNYYDPCGYLIYLVKKDKWIIKGYYTIWIA